MNLSSVHAMDQSIRAGFLENISSHDRHRIFEKAELVTVAAKNTIIQRGEPASALFLLHTGRAKYSRVTDSGKEILLWLITPGDVFGLATILDRPLGYIATATTLTDCEVVVWEHSAIVALSKIYPELYKNALRITLGYLAAYARRHGRLVSEPAHQRLAHTLVQVAHRSGEIHTAGVDVEITNEQLGSLADVGLFTTSRLLSEWERQGTIKKDRGRIRIETPEKLLAT